MGVLIDGMEMPRRGHTVTITIVGSGEAYVEYYDCRPHIEETIEYRAVPTSPNEQWMPVTETPPRQVGDEGYNGYLVYANGYYEVADYTTDKFDNAPYFHVDGEYEPDVTHWMPLPEPPKEDEA